MLKCASQSVRLRLVGEFDLADQERLNALLLPAQVADIAIIDLTATTFMDVSAFRCLLRLKKAMLARGPGVVHLVGVQPNIFKMLRICNLVNYFELSGVADTVRPREVAYA